MLVALLLLTLSQCDGCGPDMCSHQIGAGHTAVYQTSDGRQHQVTAGADGT